jgi:hypothetical protein
MLEALCNVKIVYEVVELGKKILDENDDKKTPRRERRDVISPMGEVYHVYTT